MIAPRQLLKTAEIHCDHWRDALLDLSRMKIYFPNSARLQNFDSFLKKYSPNGNNCFEVSSNDRYIYVHPAALAMAACAGVVCKNRNLQATGQVADMASVNYLVRMKLFDFLGIKPPREIAEHEEAGRFIPITQIKSSAELAKFLADIVPLLHTAPAAADAIRYVFSELGRNVIEHANSQVGSFVCAQYYKKTNRVAVGMADAGCGIFSSIRRSHHVPNFQEAIYYSLTPGITGVTPKIGGNETNAGAGLFFVKSLARLSKNYFIIYSGDTMFKLCTAGKNELRADPREDKHKMVSGLPHWNGTVVGVDIAVEKAQEFSTLINYIRRSYQIDVRQRKKQYFKGIKFK